jgi:uncharacterized protein (TIRG00374 family)
MKSTANVIKTSARFIVSFGAIGIILYLFRDQLPTVFNHLSKANPFAFVLAVFTFLAGLISVAFRLQLVLKIHKADLSVTNLYYMNLVALFFNNILPSHAGGEMVKAYYIYKGSNQNVAAFGGVVIDRLFGLITMVLIGVAAIFLYDDALASPKILSSVMMLALFTAAFCFMLFNQKIVDFLCRLHIPLVPTALLDKLRDIYQAMHHYRGHKGIVLTCIFLTLIGQTSFVFTNYFLAKSLGVAIPLGFFFYFVPIIMVLGLAPSINGIGVREATYLFYLTGFTSSEMALALSLLTSFFMVFVGIIGGVLYAFKGGVPSMKEMIHHDSDSENK